MKTNRILHIFVLVEDRHKHANKGTRKKFFLTNVSHFQVVWVMVKIQIEKGFLKEFDIFLPVILDDARQNLVRNLDLFKPT